MRRRWRCLLPLLWAVFAACVWLLTDAQALREAVQAGIVWLTATVLDGASWVWPLWLCGWLLQFCLCGGVSAALLWAAAALPAKRQWLYAAGSLVPCAALQILGSVRHGGQRMEDALLCLAGGVCALLLCAAWQIGCRRLPRVCNRETVSYVFFGALTTVINIVLANISYRLLQPVTVPVVANLASNSIAWIAAVLFAFAVNRTFVFRSHTHGRAAWREFGLFLAARVFSFAIDALGMVLLVDLLGLPFGLSKLAMNIIVLILNYIFSKRIIFRPS